MQESWVLDVSTSGTLLLTLPLFKCIDSSLGNCASASALQQEAKMLKCQKCFEWLPKKTLKRNILIMDIGCFTLNTYFYIILYIKEKCQASLHLVTARLVPGLEW